MTHGRIWYTADPHFGSDSETIVIREMRPFRNIAEYTAEQIRIWNDQAAPDDVIYILGDFCNFNAFERDWESGLAVSRRINARIVLLAGNSEERVADKYFDSNFSRFRSYCLNDPRFRFDDVRKNDYAVICGEKFFLTHKPTDHNRSCLNLFGHTHRSTGLWKPYGFCVCTDLNHFRLFSEDDIMLLLEQKNGFWDHDPDNNCF